MPNLNLNEDPRRRLRQQPLSPFKKPPITGGGSKMLPLMVLFGLLIFVGVIIYLLNQSGYLHLWGEKPIKTASVSIQEEKPLEVTQPTAIPSDEKATSQERTIENETPVSGQKQVEVNRKEERKEQKITTEIKKESQKKPLPRFAENKQKSVGGYAIFIGSYRDKKRAEEEAQRWSEAGFEVGVNEKVFNGGSGKWYRVYIGNFSDREEARRTAMKFADGFEGGYWIDVVK